MVVATLLRGAGHGEHDDASYVGAALKARFGDCLSLYERRLTVASVMGEADLIALRNQVTTLINTAVQQAGGEAQPDPAQENLNALASTSLAVNLQPRWGDT